ncbi:MAG: gliding motility-associated C-terminal domain-containing protein [Crocinitomicaceae bacterium]|nr:gliding motility-associated C-terminal domain-containing protein [Crocinitomicaceae bacterium]
MFFVPNTFTPDGNEFNNSFQPVITTGIDVQNYSLKIYNRWGELIFESRDVNVGWDGTYYKTGEMSPDGTYTWKIDLKRMCDDEHMIYHGHVNMIR